MRMGLGTAVKGRAERLSREGRGGKAVEGEEGRGGYIRRSTTRHVLSLQLHATLVPAAFQSTS
jgi:hypothetical protein